MNVHCRSLPTCGVVPERAHLVWRANFLGHDWVAVVVSSVNDQARHGAGEHQEREARKIDPDSPA